MRALFNFMDSSNSFNDRFLRKIYAEIVAGFSIQKYKNQDIFIRHSSSVYNLEIDYIYTENFNSAVNKGYPNEKERLECLIKDNFWSKGKDNEIEVIKKQIYDTTAAKRKAFLLRDINNFNEQIRQQQEYLISLFIEKDKIIGNTAEKYAKRQSDAYFIYKSFFRDAELKNSLFSKEEFDDIDNLELNDLYELNYKVNTELDENNVKKIAVKDFFIQIYSLAEGIYEFFGKPICQLTYNQINLSAYGNFFKTILYGNPKPPNEIIDDPDKLEDWYYGRQNAEEMLSKVNKDKDGNSMLVGLTNKDREFLGLESNSRTDMRERILKAGGMLTTEELYKLDTVGK